MDRSFFASFSKLIICILSLLLNGCSSLGLYHTEKIPPDKDTLYIANCSVLNYEFEIVRTLSSGYICLPLANGDWFDIVDGQLRHFSASGEVLWKKRGRFHHQIKQLDKDHILVLNAILKRVYAKLIKFDMIQKIKISTGEIINELSIYDELFLKKKSWVTGFGPELMINTDRVYRPAKLQHTHLNSINFYKDEIIINQVIGSPFRLTSELKFKNFVIQDNYILKSDDKFAHDLQITDDDSYLYFKNQNSVGGKKTFKILKIKNDKVLFEYPLNEDDFIENEYSGGVERMGPFYLFGFPVSSKRGTNSVVGLVDESGHLVKKGSLDFYIQDVKRIPFKNFLELNSMR